MKKTMILVMLMVSVCFGGMRGRYGRDGNSGPGVYIVPSDAPDSEKAKATPGYLCDGIDDDVQVQAAIDLLPSTGGILNLASGTFTLGEQVQIDNPFIKIKGQGESTVITIPDEVKTTLSSNAASGQADIVVADASGFSAGDRLIVRSGTIADGTDWEVLIIQSIVSNTLTMTTNLTNPYTTAESSVVFEIHNMFFVTATYGIEFEDIKFDGNQTGFSSSLAEITNAGGNASDVWRIPINCSSELTGIDLYNISVTGCYFYEYYNNAVLIWETTGGDPEATNVPCRAKIIDNEFETTATYTQTRAMALEAFCSYSVVSGNTIQGGTVGIYLTSSDWSTVTGNTINMGKTDYTVQDDDNIGIYTPYTNNSSITGNVIRNAGIGIKFLQFNYNTISGNTISDCYKCVTSVASGSSESRGVLITGNSFVGEWIFGIVGNLSADVFPEAVITGNYFSSSQVSLKAAHEAIKLFSSTDCHIVGNKFADTTGKCISVLTGTGNIVGNNQNSQTYYTTAGAVNVWGINKIKSSTARAMTLADGTFHRQFVRIESTLGGEHTLTVANHVTSSPEIFYLDLNEYVELEWVGNSWTTVRATANTVTD